MSVPMPASKLYTAGGAEPETLRDKFIARYGEATVHQAEHQTILDLLMMMQIVKPQEFVEILTNKLNRVDRLRQEQAGIKP